MYIQRAIHDFLEKKLDADNKVIILYGARQVGKTTLVMDIIKNYSGRKLIISADEQKYVDIFASKDLQKIKSVVSGYDLLFIDEAQRVEDIGLSLKIMHDNLKELKIITTGSSSFELANKVNEPLTGRSWTYSLYPISFMELSGFYNEFELKGLLEQCMLYGMYPELFSLANIQDKYQHLKELSNSYLYKDTLNLVNIKHSNKLNDLLRLLAFQIGSQVSINELATSLGLGKDTVDHYIDILEKAFIIFRLKGFSRNLRKEVTKMDKIYFYDLGVRNMIIDDFKPLDKRNDTGALWENFLIAERKKVIDYNQKNYRLFFWRTYTGAELDYIEERDGGLFGYEFKYNNKSPKAPKSWLDNYKEASYSCINKDNYLDFILKI